MKRTFLAVACTTAWLILTTSLSYADPITLGGFSNATFSGPAANTNGSALVVRSQGVTSTLTFTPNNFQLPVGTNTGPTNFQIGTLVCSTVGGSSNIVNPFFAGSQVNIHLSFTIPDSANPVNAIFVGRIASGPGGLRVVFDNPIFTYSKDGLIFSIQLPHFLELPICAKGCDRQETPLFGSIGSGPTPVPESETLFLVASGLGLIARWLKKVKTN